MDTLEAIMAAAISAPDELRRKALLLLTGTPASELEPEDKELTTEEVCAMFGVVRQTIFAKKIPCEKIAGRNRYRLSVVREYLKNKKR